MIENWEEIEDRFNKIKDHKPKATKKLNELGDILASAYLINPDKAIYMWDYIVDLNTKEDLDNAKFYVAQVFNKILGRLDKIQAARFIIKSENIVTLFFKNGYKIKGAFHTGSLTILKYYIIIENSENAFNIFKYIVNKFEVEGEKFYNPKYFYKFIEDIIKNIIEIKDKSNAINDFLERCMEIDDEKIYIIIFSYKIQSLSIKELKSIDDIDLKLLYCCEILSQIQLYDLCFSLFPILRYIIDESKIIELWENIILENKSNKIIKPRFGDELILYCSSLALKSKQILDYYINFELYYYIKEYILPLAIINEQWDIFSYIIFKMIALCNDRYKLRDINYLIDWIFRLCDDDTKEWEICGILKKDINSNKNKLIDAFLKGLASASNEKFYSVLVDKVSKNLININKNIKILKKYGISVKNDKRTLFDKLLDLSQKTINSNIKRTNSKDFDLELILNELEREYSNKIKFKEKILENDDICEYLFLYNTTINNLKSELMYLCIINNDLNRALYLLDLLKMTLKFENIDYTTSWEREFYFTIDELINIVNGKGYISFEVDKLKEKIDENCILNIKYIVNISCKYLNKDLSNSLKINLYTILKDYDSEEFQEIINEIQNYVIIYTTEKWPYRGLINKNKHNINTITSIIRISLEMLVIIDKIDIINWILSKIEENKESIKGPNFYGWLRCVFENSYLKKQTCYKLIKANKKIIDILINDKSNISDDINILRAFEQYGTKNEVKKIKEKIILIKGETNFNNANKIWR